MIRGPRTLDCRGKYSGAIYVDKFLAKLPNGTCELLLPVAISNTPVNNHNFDIEITHTVVCGQILLIHLFQDNFRACLWGKGGRQYWESMFISSDIVFLISGRGRSRCRSHPLNCLDIVQQQTLDLSHLPEANLLKCRCVCL